MGFSVGTASTVGCSGEKFDVKVDYKMQEFCVGFEVSLPEKKLKNKICTLCYGTGSILQPSGVKVPCPKGCPGYYPPH
jgi:hypothetical protein